jgi:hypothetical protein
VGLNVQDVPFSTDQLKDLAGYLQEKFAMVVRSRQTQIDDKAANWQRNYDAIPAQLVRTVPYYRASNFMPHLIRMHTDILGARILGILFGTHPFWMVKSLLDQDEPVETFQNISQGLNYLWENDLRGFDVSDEIVNQSLQTGTLIEKAIWSDTTTSYMGQDGNFEEYQDERMMFVPVAFEDFWPFPITARNVDSTEILFQRIRLTQRDIDDRSKDGRWDPNAAARMMKTWKVEQNADVRAQSTGINLTADVDYPYSAIEAWLSWEVAGVRRPIVVTFNPSIGGTESILRAIYNSYPYGRKPFIDFRPMPRKGSFFGYSSPEILEQFQEEQAQIHNQRRDANTIANIPSFKKLRNSNMPNPATNWYPGCVIEVEEMGDVEVWGFPGNYNSMVDEEQFLLSLAERTLGISPSMQGFGAGQSAGKRGIYATGATLAMLSEGNKRQDIYIKRARSPYHRLGEMTAMSYNQFSPRFFEDLGPKGEAIARAFETVNRQKGLNYGLTASSASENREIDRQSLLQMAGVMANYYEKLTEAAAALQQVPADAPVAKVLLAVLDGAHSLADRILFAFQQPDRNRLLPDLRQVLGAGGKPVSTRPNDASRLSSDERVVRPPQLADMAQNLKNFVGGIR